ncbi:MAG TPA: hypothetical protein VFE01_07850 [Terracidiphilus sp.]|nr:hypothetical protein [Terracidiphilus sp.]
MKRSDPPFPATWMLEHLAAGDWDEALRGDLLEEFRWGRSDGWYWRQVLAACAVSWVRGLRARVSLLILALLWSMLAPAWMAICDQIQDSPLLGHVWQVAGGLWVLPAFAVWLALHSSFLLTGVLLYISVHRSIGKQFHRDKVRRAFLLAPLIFAPAFGATFLVVNLYKYSAFPNARLAPTPVGQIADIGRFAVMVRIPYLIAMVSALWGLIPQSMRIPRALSSKLTSAESEAIAPLSTLNLAKLQRFYGLVVTAGLVNFLIVAFLLCRLPTSPASSIAALTARALLYVFLTALGGIAGARYYWHRSSVPFAAYPPLSFSLFALANAAELVWVPAILLLSGQDSLASPVLAVIAAALLAAGLRKTIASTTHPVPQHPAGVPFEQKEFLAESLLTFPREVHGYIVALCIYIAAYALQLRETLAACGLLALCAFICAWKLTLPYASNRGSPNASTPAALRLARIASIAVLATLFALLFGIDRRNRANAALKPGVTQDQTDSNKKPPSQPPASGISGYESIILWPNPPKKQIVAPVPLAISPFDPLKSKPMVIHFDGAYWYFQPPGKGPGPRAHQAHGSPLAVHIQANNFLPLIMEAHQNLATSIRLTRCREIEVDIQNHNDSPGTIALAVFLGDSSAPGKQSIYLGQEPIISSESGHFSARTFPPDEKLSFAIPLRATIRRFDEITILFLPDAQHFEAGPKIAIQDFNLLPR